VEDVPDKVKIWISGVTIKIVNNWVTAAKESIVQNLKN
jgi:hypothetical protein